MSQDTIVTRKQKDVSRTTLKVKGFYDMLDQRDQ